MCRAFARAIVAQLHGIAVSSGKYGPNHSVRVKIVERLVEDWGQKTLGLGSIVWDLVSRLGTPLLRSYRESISDLSALAIGDVLLYQSRGQEIRDFIRAKIESKDTKPKQINKMREGLTEVVDLDLISVNLNTVLTPDLDLLHGFLVFSARCRAIAQMGNQVGSLA